MEKEISYRTMKTHEFDDAVFYRVACQCGDQKCDLVLEIEYDKECESINLNMSKLLAASAHWGRDWDYFDFIRVWGNKVKLCLKIIFKGYIEVSETTMIQGEEHINGFISALQQGKKFIVGKEEEWQKFLKLQKQDPKNSTNVKSAK